MEIKEIITIYNIEITSQELTDIASCIKIADNKSGFVTDEQAKRCNNILTILEQY